MLNQRLRNNSTRPIRKNCTRLLLLVLQTMLFNLYLYHIIHYHYHQLINNKSTSNFSFFNAISELDFVASSHFFVSL
ncbi:hypothetical protein HanRHA438_Chr09g0424901 [Helianthus annuus]|nr:hypothetical protein HanIR_Chr09g0444751 [Helianthus annuus]KAJ0890542.1 hypothetical protein HanRHA438_Chr09g0424901 [Helianthus annuus]